MKNPLPALHIGLVFSGAAGLVYQSSWTRMLHQVFGVSDFAVATVLASFFLGMGIGGALGGRIAARIRRPALAYATIEIAVATIALLSLPVVPAVRSAYESIAAGAGFAVLSAVRLTFASLVLLPPTILMGMTIPVLARISSRDESWSRGVTGLYVSNTAGAIAGAALAGFWSIPSIGVRGSVLLAALMSTVAAGVVYVAFRRSTSRVESASSTPPVRTEHGSPLIALATTLALLSGATALAGEVLWTRVLRVVVHGTTTAFAAMLVNYLGGIAIGALLAPALARRLGGRRAFGLVQLAVAITFAAAMAYAPHLPRIVPLLREAPSLVPHEIGILLFLSSLLLAPLAILTGTGLPLAWVIADEAGAEAGAGSGRLLAANTLGALGGSLGAAFVLVPSIGTEASLLVVITIAALSAGIALRAGAGDHFGQKIFALVAPAIILGSILLVRPSLHLPYLLASGSSPVDAMIAGPSDAWRRDLVFLREGRNTTVTVRRYPGGLTLYNDGRPESGFGGGEVGFGRELVLLGALPGLFAEERSDVLIVGLGAGHTSSVALATGFERLIAVELEDAVVEAARLLHTAKGREFPLDDPRARLVVDDARNQISLAPAASLDAVISQPSHPWLAGSAALYTSEFFGEVERALRPGGVFALWINLFRTDIDAVRSILGTLGEVFPNVHGFVVEGSSLVIAASNTPFDWARAEERLSTMDASREFLAPSQLGTIREIGASLEIDEGAARFLGDGADHISDDLPTLEFRLARRRSEGGLRVGDFDRALEGVPWITESSALARSPSIDSIIAERIMQIAPRRRALDRVASALAGVDLDAAKRAELDGSIAESRGDLTGALEAYARAATPDSALAEDRIRLAEHQYEALLARARSRTIHPSSAAPLLEAALAIDRPAALAAAVEIADAIESENSVLRDLVAARASGCDALLVHPELLTQARSSSSLSLVAQRCALLAGDRSSAIELQQRAARLRSVEATALSTRGRAALDAGNGGLAWVLLRRALETHPSSSASAVALATLHRRDGRPLLARQVLIDAWRATEGLPDSRANIASAAAALQIDLSAEGVHVEDDVSSTAPSAARSLGPAQP